MHFFILSAIFSLAYVPNLSVAEPTPEVSFSLLKFAEEALSTVWMASCKTSKILTRSKRSLEISQWDVPEDTNDLFNYLYPSLEFDHKDFVSPSGNVPEEGRSTRSENETAPGIFALTSWIDDAVDLWTSECVGSAAKKDVDAVHNSFKNITRATGIINFFNSTGVFNKKENQNFFVSYGGDIEYFFPVWGWGIPFDGEITFLGFHGFQGIFPYKK